jgi:hypothetical protein
MQRALIILVGVVVIVLGALQVSGGLNQIFGGGGNAEIVAAASKAAKAADTFAPLAKDSAATGTVPRQADPAVGPLLDAVFNVDLVKAKTTLAQGDLGPLADWSASSARVGNAYILAGTGVSDPSKLVSDEKTIALTDRNIVTYQAELGRYLDAELVLSAAIARIIAADKTGAKAGIDRVRGGMAQTMEGAIAALTINGLTPAWRGARAAALVAAAPPAAALLLPDQCKSLRAAATEVSTVLKDPPVADRLRAFNTAMNC